jgi:hypothetical protein
MKMGIIARGVVAVLVALAVTPAASHHGWLWAEDENFELTGVVKSARLGNPHGLLTVEAKGGAAGGGTSGGGTSGGGTSGGGTSGGGTSGGGTSGGGTWTVEVGQPWRNKRAGLTDDKLVPGVELTASGHRSSDRSRRLMKAERIIISGRTYDLYPERD